MFVDDGKNINIVKKEIGNEYFEPDDDWKPEIIELSDSDDNSQEIENFLEKVVREKKEDKVNINKDDRYMNTSNDDVKEEEEYGEICKETKGEVKEEDEHSKAASINEVKESTSEVHHTEISSNKKV